MSGPSILFSNPQHTRSNHHRNAIEQNEKCKYEFQLDILCFHFVEALHDIEIQIHFKTNLFQMQSKAKQSFWLRWCGFVLNIFIAYCEGLVFFLYFLLLLFSTSCLFTPICMNICKFWEHAIIMRAWMFDFVKHSIQ